ncbi:MAG: UDP-N-acetylmuramoyl-tripeptide--D-alanyl-D-alanine ligase [Gallionella sp.]
MMQLSQVEQATGGKLLPGPQAMAGDITVNRVSSDSRKVAQGDLFIALRGEHFDGYAFVGTAAQAGATAAMVNADSCQVSQQNAGEQAAVPLVLVDDTRLALGRLAGWWRSRFSLPVVAITGSNGKTTVKEMLASILSVAAGTADAVLATRGNLNNDIGMPLTLLRMNEGHRYAVIEMGMNHSGEIDYLTRIAEPDVALINNASGAHLEGLGSVEAVAQAKGEIFAGLRHHGTAVINSDDCHAPIWRTLAGAHPLLEFGLNANADISGTWHPLGNGLRLDVTAPQGMFAADLQVPGMHNALNALAATAAATVLKIPLETIAAGLEKFSGVTGRLQRKPALHGAIMIDDTYNANPSSMRAAISVLAQAPGKRILVLGDMGELGGGAADLHAGIGAEARLAGIEKLFALGALSVNTVREFGSGAQHFAQIGALQDALENELDANTTVLVKGSRFMKMERVVEHFTVH